MDEKPNPSSSPAAEGRRAPASDAPEASAAPGLQLSDQTVKALVEGIIYVAPQPVSLDHIVRSLAGQERDRIKASLEELITEYDRPEHGIHIRQVANGYKFSSKAEHHDVLRGFVKSLKPPLRLSKPALETLAVIAYRQPVTLPEIDQIRGVDCGGVIHTLLEKRLVVTAGRKNVVGRPILYRTSRDFLVHFGLKDASELPSLKEFEALARQALGSETGQETRHEHPDPRAVSAPPSAIHQETTAGSAEPPNEVGLAGQREEQEPVSSAEDVADR